MMTQFGLHRTSLTPDYVAKTDDGVFTAQIKFDSSKLPGQFSFYLTNKITGMATGPTIIANATRTPPNCTYNKPNVAVNYPFHWSCPSHQTATSYVEDGHWKFPASIGGKPGKIDIYWQFRYIIYLRIT